MDIDKLGLVPPNCHIQAEFTIHPLARRAFSVEGLDQVIKEELSRKIAWEIAKEKYYTLQDTTEAGAKYRMALYVFTEKDFKDYLKNTIDMILNPEFSMLYRKGE